MHSVIVVDGFDIFNDIDTNESSVMYVFTQRMKDDNDNPRKIVDMTMNMNSILDCFFVRDDTVVAPAHNVSDDDDADYIEALFADP